MEVKQQLTFEETQKLRMKKLLSEEEYAYKAGDLILAENPVTAERRIVGRAYELLSENNKRVLKG